MVRVVVAVTNAEAIEMSVMTVGDVARRLGVNPSMITMLFYRGHVRPDRCPVVGGRRLIPPDMVDVIAMALRRRGVRVLEAATPARKVGHA